MRQVESGSQEYIWRRKRLRTFSHLPSRRIDMLPQWTWALEIYLRRTR